MRDIKIKDVPLVESLTGQEKIPVSDGSGSPKAISVLLILDKTSAPDLSLYAFKSEIPTDYLTEIPEATAYTLGGIKKVYIDSIAEDSDIVAVVAAYNNLITKLTESGVLFFKKDYIQNNYLTIEALEDGLTASLSLNDCEYCIDGDGDWKTLIAGTPTESINTGQTLSFRGNLTPDSSNGIGTFTISKKCNVSGNIMSMLFGDDGKDSLSLSGKDYAFRELFLNCTNIISAKDLYLPATTLATGCYRGMFSDCTSLTTTPELPATTLAELCYCGMFSGCTGLTTAKDLYLPATTLAENCYGSMFYGCTSLTTAPTTLPATTLADLCYASMFYGCTSLTTAPVLHATTLAASCCMSMFQDCTSLTTVPELPATTLATGCYQYMFSGCTLLVVVPVLPATTLANRCYQQMFQNCTSLTTAPELPATELAHYCYLGMFYDCANLNHIKMLATDISAYNCLKNWVSGVSSTGTFVKHPDMTSLPTGIAGIPEGWTVQDA